MKVVSTFSQWPALQGAWLALLAALLFGVSTPFIKTLGQGLGPFTTAALLYLGAGLVGLVVRRGRDEEAGLRRTDLARLILIAGLGAVLAPVALAWGLSHTSATGASLMITLEAFFTTVLARSLYGEVADRRVFLAMSLLFLGAVVLVVDQAGINAYQGWGLLAVAIATLAWAADNTLSRVLADRDPAQVVFVKSTFGSAGTLILALVAGEPLPGIQTTFAIVAVGASGYGISLMLYLRAQRSFGASRTGSVFAFAPFVGAATAFFMGEREVTNLMLVGGFLMVGGVLAHLAEKHVHEHQHGPLNHEHAHRHDDSHHDHSHFEYPLGEHNHEHTHSPQTHSHPHVPDIHHDHAHP